MAGRGTQGVLDALVHADVRLRLEDFLQRGEAHDSVADVCPLAWVSLGRSRLAGTRLLGGERGCRRQLLGFDSRCRRWWRGALRQCGVCDVVPAQL